MQSRRWSAHCSFIEQLEQRRLLSVNVTVHHGDAANDGENLAETVLTPANVNPTDFGKLFTTQLDGAVFAQPLYVQNVNITRGSSQGVHSVIYVATMHDSLYAIDANLGTVLWKDNFLNIADPTNLTPTSGVTTVGPADVGNTSPSSELGILATPAIDTSLGRIFLNAESKEKRGSDTHYVQRLWAVNLSNGKESVAPAVIGDTISNKPYYDYTGYKYVAGPIVNGSGNNAHPTSYPNTDGWASAPGGAKGPVIAYNALIQMQRTAVTILNGEVYMASASHGDDGPYYGWLLGYSESNLALKAAFVTTPTYDGIVGDREDYTAQAGFWASGSAISTDGTYLYIADGNGAFNPAASNFDSAGFPKDHDYGDSLLKLQVDSSSSSSKQNGNGWGLKVADYFTPSNEVAMNELDLDLGSSGVLLLPSSLKDKAGHPMLVFGGKESRIYLVDQDNLGKFNTSYPATGNPDPRLYDRVLGEYPSAGENTKTQGLYSDPSYYSGKIYIGLARGPALVFNATSFASGSIPPGTSNLPSPISSTSAFGYPGVTFSISANGSSNGVAWAIDYANSALLAYNANSVVSPIYSSNTSSTDPFTSPVKFTVPTVVNGMAYIGTNNALIAYGLHSAYLNSNSSFFSAPSSVTVKSESSTDNRVSWTSHSSLANEYRIDRSSDGGKTWTTLAYVSNSQISWDDTSASSTTKYQYRVSGVSWNRMTASASSSVPVSIGSISGTVFNDANGNQKQDGGETGLSGWTVYIDANNDNKLDDGEQQIMTDKNGNYTLKNVAAGNWIVRANRPSGWSQTTPKNNLGQHITVSAGKTTSGVSFGEKKI